MSRHTFIPVLFCLLLNWAVPAAGQLAAPALYEFREDFELGNKSTYSAGAVNLKSGLWQLDNALNGKSDNDLKNDNSAIRIKPGGHAATLFDFPATAREIQFNYGTYGSDDSSRISVWISENKGAFWNWQGVVWTSAPVERTAVLRINPLAPFRLRIQNDGPARLNIDDLYLTGGHLVKTRTSLADSIRFKSRDNALILGNPSHANKANRDNFLLTRPQYSLSYNASKGRANWVAWHLSLDWEGNAPRSDRFLQDTALPAAFYRAKSSDYLGTGFDRGHLCPSDDRSASETDNDATFLMSNIVPQAPSFNQNSWRELEAYARSLSAVGFEVYAFAGVYGVGGIGKTGDFTSSLANGKIEVPARFFKILIILPKGENDLSRIDKDTRVIAVDMPNDENRGAEDWRTFRVSVADIEKVSGCKFFENLPEGVQKALKNKVDSE